MEEIELSGDKHAVVGTDDSGDLYGVVGYPISHSRSPFIHGLFARQTLRRMVYRKYAVAPEEFYFWVLEFFREHGKGLNVTVPHKQAAATLATELTPRAERAGAANTLSKQGNRIIGDNTDGAGLVRDLRDNLDITIANSSILILGAGGATRGALAPLLALEPSTVVIANRSPERAHDLAASFKDLGNVRGGGFDELGARPIDIIINATSAGLTGQLPNLDPALVGPQTVCYDMTYGREATPFTRWAVQHGCERAIKGWGMLVEQAAESFQLWHGLRPETAAVIAILSADEVAPA